MSKKKSTTTVDVALINETVFSIVPTFGRRQPLQLNVDQALDLFHKLADLLPQAKAPELLVGEDKVYAHTPVLVCPRCGQATREGEVAVREYDHSLNTEGNDGDLWFDEKGAHIEVSQADDVDRHTTVFVCAHCDRVVRIPADSVSVDFA
jgi:hypothetical protein